MIEFIVISLSVILLVDYITSGKNLSRPSISYIGGFLLCAIVAYNWRVEWGLHKLSYGTLYFIVGGALLYFVVEFVYFKMYPIKTKEIDVSSDCFIPIKPIKLLLFFIFQIIAFYLFSKAKMAIAGTDNLAEALGQLNEETKFQGIALKIPAYARIPYYFCRSTGYIWAILLPFYMFKSREYRIQKFLIILNFLACMVGVFLSGGRMGFVFYLIPMMIFFYIIYQNSVHWRGGFFSKKVMIILVGVLFLLGTFWSGIGEAMGRKETKKLANEIFAIYCGAEIKNLDDYIRFPYKQKDEGEHFGQYTFKGMYGSIFDRTFKLHHRSSDLDFNGYGYYSLGNVYTTYQDYYIDFRYWGIWLAGLMSLVTAFFYRKAICSHFWENGRMTLGILFYAYIANMPLLCFFANQFWGKFTINGEVKTIIYWGIMIIYLQGYRNNYLKRVKPE